MSPRKSLVAILTVAFFIAASAQAQVDLHAVKVSAVKLEQSGTVPAPVSKSGKLVVAREVEAECGILVEFDLSQVKQTFTPAAQFQFELESLQATGLAERSSKVRGALHVWNRSVGDKEPSTLAGSRVIQQRRGIVVPYVMDLTSAVNEKLARGAGDRKLRLEMKLSGKPGFSQVYGMANLVDPAGATPATVDGLVATTVFSNTSAKGGAPAMLIAPSEGWEDDFKERMTSVWEGVQVYRESCLPIPPSRDEELTMQLLFPARRIVEVTRCSNGQVLQEGRDWALRDGKLIIPAGSTAPVMLYNDFFAPAEKKPTTRPTAGPPGAAKSAPE